MPDLDHLLREALACDASDLHLAAGYPPTFRVHGQLRRGEGEPLTADQLEELARQATPAPLRERNGTRDLDCSVTLEHEGHTRRFRASIHRSHGNHALTLRTIAEEIPSLEWLGLPDALADRLVLHPHGLVIITGVTGAGKSTTLAALIRHLRGKREVRILTIEEPIEYVHTRDLPGLVTQREVGVDTDTFASGLRHGLRQDPDVILVGEIRDAETAQIAITAAETGHLVLTTLHTRDAKGAVTRLLDLFPQNAQEDVRKQLAMSLRSIVSQHLLPPSDGDGKRVLALEVLHNNTQCEVAIRTGKIEGLESVVQTGKRSGMLTLDEHLQQLVREKAITLESARRIAKDPESLSGAW